MPRPRYYRGDPRWLHAKYPGQCHGQECGRRIVRGDRVFYFPSTKAIYCEECGDAHSRRFESEAEDEYLNQFSHAM